MMLLALEEEAGVAPEPELEKRTVRCLSAAVSRYPSATLPPRAPQASPCLATRLAPHKRLRRPRRPCRRCSVPHRDVRCGFISFCRRRFEAGSLGLRFKEYPTRSEGQAEVKSVSNGGQVRLCDLRPAAGHMRHASKIHGRRQDHGISPPTRQPTTALPRTQASASGNVAPHDVVFSVGGVVCYTEPYEKVMGLLKETPRPYDVVFTPHAKKKKKKKKHIGEFARAQEPPPPPHHRRPRAPLNLPLCPAALHFACPPRSALLALCPPPTTSLLRRAPRRGPGHE